MNDTTRPSLVLGNMPQGATPESHFPAGPWCFAGQEELFPDWEERFSFPPEPLLERACAVRAAAEAQQLCALLVRPVAASLLPQKTSLPSVYWETLLAPWLIMATSQVVERYYRVQALIEAWGTRPLRVEILPEVCSFAYATEQEAILSGALGEAYNHWLFSRLLELAWPCAWEKVVLPPYQQKTSPKSLQEQKGIRVTLRRWVRRMVRRLPFPPLKDMSLGQALRFSWHLCHASQGEERSRSFLESFAPEGTTSFPLSLETVLPLCLALLPESIRSLEHPTQIRSCRTPRLRVASVAAYEESAYRQELAVWRAQGHRLLFAQHGGNYGQIATVCATAVVEYTQHAFATWGWSTYTAQGLGQGKGPLWLPLPYPQLDRIKDAWQGGGEHLLVIGTEMPMYAYRLDARPTPLQVVQYRDDKQWFLEALPRDVQDVTRYRPYFSLPGSLDDAQWLLPRFPHVHLCTGALEPQMFSCRLLVVDHSSTTLLQALVANVPTIAFWGRDVWPLTPEAERALTLLEKAGIWHPTAESAAAKVYDVWGDPQQWWQREDVQAARRAFCQEYAMTADHGDDVWCRCLKQL